MPIGDLMPPQVGSFSPSPCAGRCPGDSQSVAVFDFIGGWYNPHRRHSAFAYESPINYERQRAAYL
jgi:hypothetical protein